MKHKKDSSSEKLNLESFFLLIKPEKKIYSDHSRRSLFYKKLEELVNLGL